MTRYINLQNAPSPDTVQTGSAAFFSNGVELKGDIYKPGNGKSLFPAVIVTGAWTTVKEQMPGTYARALAEQGFVALAFDFAGWGQSAGDRRYVEDPVAKTADIHAAVEYMDGRSDVDSAQITGLGICASAGYMAEAVATNGKLSRLALVAPWLHDPEMAEAVYGGAEQVAKLVNASEIEDSSNNATVLVAASTTDDSSPMYQAPYYTEESRGLIPEYDNKFSLLTWKPWLTYNAHASAERMNKPILMVGSSGMALPAGAQRYESKTAAPLEKVWFGDDVNQFDFYDRKDIVDASVEAIAAFGLGTKTS